MTSEFYKLKNKTMKLEKQNWIYLAFALAFLLLTILTSQTPKNELEPLPPMLHIDYEEYKCPPVLTAEQCKKRIDMCVFNNLDVDDYLLAVYNHLK